MAPRTITFQGGLRSLLGFGVAIIGWGLVFVSVEAAVADRPTWIGVLVEVGKFTVLAGIIWLVLRIEDVRFGELGLSRHHLYPAMLAFAGMWIALNLLGMGLATIFGTDWSLSLIWSLSETGSQLYGSLRAPWLTAVLLEFLVIGLVEEVVFRGYFQSKIIALLGDATRGRTAVGIVTTSVLFGALHTPGAVVSGAAIGDALNSAALPALTGVFFGAFYEWTQNVYFVALLHGLGNTWPLVIEWASWSGNALLAFWVGTTLIYLTATVAYRYWTLDTSLSPVVTRADAPMTNLFDDTSTG